MSSEAEYWNEKVSLCSKNTLPAECRAGGLLLLRLRKSSGRGEGSQRPFPEEEFQTRLFGVVCWKGMGKAPLQLGLRNGMGVGRHVLHSGKDLGHMD